MTTKSKLPKIPGVPDLSKVTTVAQAAKGVRLAMQRTKVARGEIESRFGAYLIGCVETGYRLRHLKQIKPKHVDFTDDRWYRRARRHRALPQFRHNGGAPPVWPPIPLRCPWGMPTLITS